MGPSLPPALMERDWRCHDSGEKIGEVWEVSGGLGVVVFATRGREGEGYLGRGKSPALGVAAADAAMVA